jgi:hypothetical protein
VLRLEPNSERNGQLLARWSVVERRQESGGFRKSRTIRNAKEKSTDGSVAGFSEAVGNLSRKIAYAVGENIDHQTET